MKRLLIGGIISVAVLSLVLVGFAVVRAQNAPTMTEKSIDIASAVPRYVVRGSFAQVRTCSPAHDGIANEALQAVVDREVATFRSYETDRAADLAKDPAMYRGTSYADATSELDISSTVELATPGLLSIRFTFASYHAGAAHGMTETAVINIDLAQGRVLTRRDLFTDETAALKVVVSSARAALKQKLAPQSADERQWIMDGTDPARPGNLRNIALTPQGLLVVFDPYEVTCYANGPQEVLIPRSAIQSLLNITLPPAH